MENKTEEIVNLELKVIDSEFKPGVAVRIKNTDIRGTVIGIDEKTGRVTILYFDNARVARDLFLPPQVLVLVAQEENVE
jgi:hypothetical protein